VPAIVLLGLASFGRGELRHIGKFEYLGSSQPLERSESSPAAACFDNIDPQRAAAISPRGKAA